MELEFDAPPKAVIDFFVSGTPAPGGSKSFMGLSKKTGRAILIDAGGRRNKNWRAAVAATAREVAPRSPLAGAVAFTMLFTMPRPKYHFHTGKRKFGRLREEYASAAHVVDPDTTKLVRSTEDALKGIIWVDDCQVVSQAADKIYGDKPGCRILITEL